MKHIRLYWFHDVTNLGDVLNLYLIPKIVGEKVKIKNVDPYTSGGRFRFSRSHVLYLWHNFKGNERLGLIIQYARSFFTHYSVIGSILRRTNENTIVWGSGCMENDEKVKSKRVLAVRGKLSLNNLLKQGYDTNGMAVGDPALLLPLYYTPKNTKKYKLSIIPHYVDEDDIRAMNLDANIISARTADIESYVNEVCASEYILSSSLHGLIIAHTYGIPALWIEKNSLDSSSFKFMDYFSSVGIEAYQGFRNIEELLSEDSGVEKLFAEHKLQALPQVDLEPIRKQLLSVCPFLPKNIKP